MIFYIAIRAEWEAVTNGDDAPSSPDTEGFIHRSPLAQLIATVNLSIEGDRI
jgi:uncharacterized protein (DUF952 family)